LDCAQPAAYHDLTDSASDKSSEHDADSLSDAAPIGCANGTTIGCADPMWVCKWRPLCRHFECSNERDADFCPDSFALGCSNRTADLRTIAGTLTVADDFAHSKPLWCAHDGALVCPICKADSQSVSCAFARPLCEVDLLSDQSHGLSTV
jgi:hypothetical protein